MKQSKCALSVEIRGMFLLLAGAETELAADQNISSMTPWRLPSGIPPDQSRILIHFTNISGPLHDVHYPCSVLSSNSCPLPSCICTARWSDRSWYRGPISKQSLDLLSDYLLGASELSSLIGMMFLIVNRGGCASSAFNYAQLSRPGTESVDAPAFASPSLLYRRCGTERGCLLRVLKPILLNEERYKGTFLQSDRWDLSGSQLEINSNLPAATKKQTNTTSNESSM